MTHDEIMALDGRALDAAVAEHIMGWVDVWTNGERWMAYPPCEQSLPVGCSERHHIPDYSGDMGAAIAVFQAMIDAGHAFSLEPVKRGARATFRPVSDDPETVPTAYSVVDESAPRAICRAALWAHHERRRVRA